MPPLCALQFLISALVAPETSGYWKKFSVTGPVLALLVPHAASSPVARMPPVAPAMRYRKRVWAGRPKVRPPRRRGLDLCALRPIMVPSRRRGLAAAENSPR